MPWLSVLVLGLFVVQCSPLGPRYEKGDVAVRVASVTDLGAIESAQVIRGRDGGYSGVFDGRSVWLFGDTVLEQADEHGQSWHHNSWSWTSDLDASDGIDGFQERVDMAGAPRPLFPLTPSEQSFNDTHFGSGCSEEPCGARWAHWPGAIVSDSVRTRALVFYSKVYAEPGNFNFRAVGYSLAIWRDFEAEPERPEFGTVPGHPTLLFSDVEPSFGSAAVIVDQTLYVYGRKGSSVRKPIHIARVPLERALDRGSWRYFAGSTGWVDDLDDSKSVFDGNDILSVFYSSHSATYIAVYSEPLSRDILLRSASCPEGPWSESTRLFRAMEPEGDSGWIYDALAHPEYTQGDDGAIYVTYSRATGFFESELRLVSVELNAVSDSSVED